MNDMTPENGQEPVSGHTMNRRTFLAAGAAVGMGAALANVAGKSSIRFPASNRAIDMERELQKPARITFWTWVSKIQQQVSIFEKKYPHIKVDVVDVGQGPTEYSKLLTAVKAGRGAPDVAQIEYLELPTFLAQNALADLSQYGARSLQDRFVSWVWGQVSQGDKVWAIPQDSGPMGMLYRKDIFDQYGITVPSTYEEFAAAGRKLHKANPKIAMTNLSNNDAGFFLGFVWQAGGRPFTKIHGNSIGISLNDAASKRVAEYWMPLVNEGVVTTVPDYTPTWYKGLSTGQYATWLTAAWGALFLSANAGATSGKWRAAPLPQWAAGKHVSGNAGGSSNAVLAQSSSPAAAAAFAMFINTNPECTKLFTQPPQYLFPTTKELLSNASFLGEKPAFFGGQEVNKVFASVAPTVSENFVWSPFEQEVNTEFNDTVGKALANRQNLVAALDAWQSSVTQYASSEGLKVTG